jgi:hypothetical protein
MSVWFFLSEWFGDVPTLGTAFRRMLVNIIVGVDLVYFYIIAGAPDISAKVILLGMFVGNGVLIHVFRRQRTSARNVG